MPVRSATSTDVPGMTILIEAERERYASWQPLMWRKAKDSSQKTQDWFPHLIAGDGVIALANDDAEGNINGFIVAYPQTPPPVYDPGKTYMIDDFCVANDSLWLTIGRKLLAAALKAAKEAGATQCLSVCPVAHEKKATLLSEVGLMPASTWSAIAL